MSLGHFLAPEFDRRFGHAMLEELHGPLIGTSLPSAAQSLVELDQSDEFVALRLRES